MKSCPEQTILQCGDKVLDLSAPQVMGILNVTPDSFSDGGLYRMTHQAVERGEQMMVEGAAIIDVGGESTRQGAKVVSLQEELDRVIPVIERLRSKISIPISIDTYKPAVMVEAVKAGANFINDIYALRKEGALQTAAGLNVPVCLMHMQGEPLTMQEKPQYQEVVSEVLTFLKQRVEACVSAGILRQNCVVDPGFGFGKLLSHNLSLLRALEQFTKIGVPVLTGLSRKRMIQDILNLPVHERIFGSVSCAVIAAMKGASIIRVHDVKATVEALQIVSAVRENQRTRSLISL